MFIPSSYSFASLPSPAQPRRNTSVDDFLAEANGWMRRSTARPDALRTGRQEPDDQSLLATNFEPGDTSVPDDAPPQVAPVRPRSAPDLSPPAGTPLGMNEHGAPTDAPLSVDITPTPRPDWQALQQNVVMPAFRAAQAVGNAFTPAVAPWMQPANSNKSLAAALGSPAKVVTPQSGMTQQTVNVAGYGPMRGYSLPSGDTFVAGHGSATGGFWPNRLTPTDVYTPDEQGIPRPNSVLAQLYTLQQNQGPQQQQADASTKNAEAYMLQAQAQANSLKDIDRKAVLTTLADPNLSPQQKVEALRNMKLGENYLKSGGGDIAQLQRELERDANSPGQSDVLAALEAAGLKSVHGADRSVTSSGTLNPEALADAVLNQERLRQGGIPQIADQLRRSNLPGGGLDAAKRAIAANLIRYSHEATGRHLPTIGGLGIEHSFDAVRVRGPGNNTITIPRGILEREDWWPSQFEDHWPTILSSTKEQYGRRADVLSQLLENLLQ